MAEGRSRHPLIRACALGALTVALAGCEDGLDFDLRNTFNGFDTSSAVRQATEARPKADNRGVISYPNYQVVVARQGDTVTSVANRLGLGPAELARFNGLSADTALRSGEILALPRRFEEPSPATGSATTGPLQPQDNIDVTTLAGNAIDRATPNQGGTANGARKTADQSSGREPIRHKVERGETAFSIARLYNISVKSLADWNGLSGDLNIREGQFLLIPVALESDAVTAAPITAPGTGSQTPEPPSAAKALPDEDTAAKEQAPASPNLGQHQTSASAARMASPVDGKIIRAFVPKKNDGIDIAAAAGTTVKAADSGTVAAITEDTDQVPILVLRHKDNLLTVYANIDKVKVKKGDKVKRGQAIAVVRATDPSFLHFEVREGFEAVDPIDFLN